MTYTSLYWEGKRAELTEFIKNNPNSTRRDIAAIYSSVLNKFYDDSINRLKKEAGLPERFKSSLSLEEKERKKGELINFVKENPWIKAPELRKNRKYYYLFVNFYKGNMAKLRKEAGVYEYFSELSRKEISERKDSIVKLIKEKPILKRKEFNRKDNNLSLFLFDYNLSKPRTEAGLFPVYKKKRDSIDEILYKYSMALRGYVELPLETLVKIESSIEELSSLEKDVIRLRYGLNCEPLITLEAIGAKYEVSKQYIYIIEQKAKEKLKALNSLIKLKNQN